jgi:hypothetical protein
MSRFTGILMLFLAALALCGRDHGTNRKSAVTSPLESKLPAKDSAVVRTLVEYLDNRATQKTVTIEYDNGGWHLQTLEKKYYTTYFPFLLYEVEKDIVKTCRSK